MELITWRHGKPQLNTSVFGGVLSKGDVIHQYDVDTAFLYGILEEEVYVYPPLGVIAGRDQVFKLNRSLYG